MTELILSSACPSGLNLDSSKKELHNSLKNLDFEKSGHKGFQKELSTEQLQNINAIQDKEDKANKTTDITIDSTDEQYPSAKAVQNKTAWELIDSAQFTEDVQQFTTIENGNKYKEMFLRIVIPTMNPGKTTDFPKARVNVTDQNGTGLFAENYPIYQDFGYEQYLTINAKLFGGICITERTFADMTGHLVYATTGSGEFSYAPFGNVKTGGVKLTNNYLTKLSIIIHPAGERLFPNETYYELWGVRA